MPDGSSLPDLTDLLDLNDPPEPSTRTRTDLNAPLDLNDPLEPSIRTDLNAPPDINIPRDDNDVIEDEEFAQMVREGIDILESLNDAGGNDVPQTVPVRRGPPDLTDLFNSSDSSDSGTPMDLDAPSNLHGSTGSNLNAFTGAPQTVPVRRGPPDFTDLFNSSDSPHSSTPLDLDAPSNLNAFTIVPQTVPVRRGPPDLSDPFDSSDPADSSPPTDLNAFTGGTVVPLDDTIPQDDAIPDDTAPPDINNAANGGDSIWTDEQLAILTAGNDGPGRDNGNTFEGWTVEDWNEVMDDVMANVFPPAPENAIADDNMTANWNGLMDDTVANAHPPTFDIAPANGNFFDVPVDFLGNAPEDGNPPADFNPVTNAYDFGPFLENDNFPAEVNLLAYEDYEDYLADFENFMRNPNVAANIVETNAMMINGDAPAFDIPVNGNPQAENYLEYGNLPNDNFAANGVVTNGVVTNDNAPHLMFQYASIVSLNITWNMAICQTAML
ncbi:hypothetical protein IWX46DRAFT_79218 [Phyllosticta citricarpa]|uniref:Uncharacterized protein n=1 Tax=Phyllosticta citricarpa TaxID=55181 RepID=A0ABR1MFU9_9PEZI